MNKSDKELATEITVAMINANPRTSTPNGSISQSLPLQAVQNAFNSAYQMVHSVKD